jgi:hypothetical protein
MSMNNLAELLVKCEAPRLRDPARAVELATQATKTTYRPHQAEHWSTLGIARYRVGDWNGALQALNTYMDTKVKARNPEFPA